MRKYELTSNKTWLRKTLVQKDGIKEKSREFLYLRIDDYSKKQWIDFRSENWKAFGIEGRNDYLVLEQRDASDKPTGFIKVIKRSKATINGFIYKTVIARDEEDWMYYEKRGN